MHHATGTAIHSYPLSTTAHQISAALSADAFARCTLAERQQLHAPTQLMAKPVQGAADFAHTLDSAAHQRAKSLAAGNFAGCTTQERMQLHMLALALAETAEHAQALTARPRPTSSPDRVMSGVFRTQGSAA